MAAYRFNDYSGIGALALTIRPRLFLTFATICITPLLVLSAVNFWYGLRNTRALLRHSLELESSSAVHLCETLLEQREGELRVLANGPFSSYLRSSDASAIDPLKHSVESLPAEYAAVAGFGPEAQQVFLAEKNFDSWTYRTRDFIPDSVPNQFGGAASSHAVVHHPRLGNVWRYIVPIRLASSQNFAGTQGTLVGDIKLDQVFEAIDKGSLADDSDLTRRLIVLDSEQRIVYHENGALRNQPVATALPSFGPLATIMTSPDNRYGIGEFRGVDGDTWIVNYRRVFPGLSLAVARDYSLASQPARRAGWLGITLSLVLGSIAALIVTLLYQRKSQSLERVTESVKAIAKGKLDEELMVGSSDDMRSLADNVNLMTERLREQFAREAETRQLNSFVKLSAMLAHDLKNAIEGLSLMVGNIERHFDNPSFRTDAMHALTASTNKLRNLVTRLSNPVNTLSGEFKMPRPTDLVPLLQRVVRQIADPVRHQYEIDVQLPPSLFAMADGERMEKVMENLVLNAVEAMHNSNGKLTVRAGTDEGGKAFFSVADTGPGMTSEFIQQRLFRPFSTTKARGVGLGLYTCREVVRANNGKIEVESKPGSGTTFRVVLASAQL